MNKDKEKAKQQAPGVNRDDRQERNKDKKHNQVQSRDRDESSNKRDNRENQEQSNSRR